VRSHPVPRVGDTVRLNRYGLRRIFGTTVGLSHMLTLEMLITAVDKESMTEPEQTFLVKVNNSDINRFLIDHWCFDIVPGKRSYMGPMPR
jgi:hypothetical protein